MEMIEKQGKHGLIESTPEFENPFFSTMRRQKCNHFVQLACNQLWRLFNWEESMLAEKAGNRVAEAVKRWADQERGWGLPCIKIGYRLSAEPKSETEPTLAESSRLFFALLKLDSDWLTTVPVLDSERLLTTLPFWAKLMVCIRIGPHVSR